MVWVEIVVDYDRFNGRFVNGVRIYSEVGIKLGDDFRKLNDDECEEWFDIIDEIVLSGLIKEIWLKEGEFDVLMVKVKD